MKMYDVDSFVLLLSVSQLMYNPGENEITQAQWYNAIQHIEAGFTGQRIIFNCTQCLKECHKMMFSIART